MVPTLSDPKSDPITDSLINKQRLDVALIDREICRSRSQASDLIKRGLVTVNGSKCSKPNYKVGLDDILEIQSITFVSRAGEKLAGIYKKMDLDFYDKVILDVGSSTGGFTDFALSQKAKKIVAVDVGTNQMVEPLRSDPRVELHEKTDIRDFKTDQQFDYIMIDVSFISFRNIFLAIKELSTDKKTKILLMFKPQFESGDSKKHKGVVKNSKTRRDIIKSFELWLVSQNVLTLGKIDSEVHGQKGNQERFYLILA